MKPVMSSRLKTGIVVCVVASVGAALLAVAYSELVGGEKLYGAVTGAVIVAPIVAFEMFVMRGHVGAPLRHLPLWGLTLVSTGVWSASVFAGLAFIAPAIFAIGPLPEWYLKTGFKQDALFALLVVVFINFAVRIHSLVGTRVLLNFLLGRYHRPLREEQVFMFVDILDARGLSKRLGDIRAQSLIAAALFDIDEPVREFGGEIHRYIADELVVTWPLARGVRDARCVKCALKVDALIRAKAERYRKTYGEAPRLRIALHGGPIVVSEIGDERREIVYFGDTINTTARLRSLAKKVQRSIVVSAALLARLQLPGNARAEDIGTFELSGKAEGTRVFAVHGDGPEAAHAGA
jgi:adenylate cyclase